MFNKEIAKTTKQDREADGKFATLVPQRWIIILNEFKLSFLLFKTMSKEPLVNIKECL